MEGDWSSFARFRGFGSSVVCKDYLAQRPTLATTVFGVVL